MNWAAKAPLLRAWAPTSQATIALELAEDASDNQNMFRSLPLLSRWNPSNWSRRSTLGASSSLRVEVCPPSLRCAPGDGWHRLLFWLLAPAPQHAAPPTDRLPRVRTDFSATLADIDNQAADELRERLSHACSLRELWHARSEVYRVVSIAFSQAEAERRLALLNRHFPTRAPRSQFAPL
jgi:hypothetical protein